MSKKSILIIAASLLIFVGFFYFVYINLFSNNNMGNGSNYSTLKEYYESIDYSCNLDSDCEIKDIRSCVGYLPQCTNSSFIVEAEFVKNACKRGDINPIGNKYPPINICKCENKKCQGLEK